MRKLTEEERVKSDARKKERRKIYYEENRERRVALSAAYGGGCLCCGVGGKLTVDHVVPLSKGGHDGVDNIQPLCLRCNQKKGAQSTDYRPLRQIAMSL